MNPDNNASRLPRIRLYRDPRDPRELLTDILGVTVESSTQEARADHPIPSSSNPLGQRKRERAWNDIGDPLNRLMEETLLYPVEPMPEPNDADFPTYEPQLPQPPLLHDTQTALDRLLEAIGKLLPPSPEPPVLPFRDDEATPLPPLPDPHFGTE